MKKLVFALIVFLNTVQISAQSWVDLGLKGQWGPTFLYNQSIFDDGHYNNKLTTKGGFGFKVGYNFNDKHELTFDFMINSFQQDFDYNFTDTLDDSFHSHISSIGYKSLDYILMYRNNSNGSYFEIGPVISTIRSVNRTDDFLSSTTDSNFDLDKVNTLQTGIVFGFGSYFVGTDNFGVTGGFRISYMFSDLISTNGYNANYPKGNLMSTGQTSASHPLMVQLVFEANLDFAYLAHAKCGRTKMIFF